MLVWLSKDPDEEVIRGVDWTVRLDGDTIASAAFSVASGNVTVSPGEYAESVSQCLVSGGTAETKATVLCEVTTTEGQTLQQTATILIRAR